VTQSESLETARKMFLIEDDTTELLEVLQQQLFELDRIEEFNAD
jgi:hypothetical protein